MIASAIDRNGLTPGAASTAEPDGPKRAEREHDVTVSRVQAQAWSAVPSQGVQLPAPAPGVAHSLQPQTLANIKQLVSTVIHDSSRLTQQLLVAVPRLAAARLSSPQAFEIELSRITSELGSAQKANKLEDIKRAREQNLQKMDDNQKKIQESQDAAKEAQKSGLAAKIFGWVSAVASIIVGLIMVATGAGAIAGALMIAGGVMGIVSQSVQAAAAAGWISKETMEKLGPVLMGIEIAVALMAAVASFGGTAVAGVAKLGAKMGTKVAELTATIASKVTEFGSKFGTVASLSMSHGAKLGVQVADVTLDVANGASQAVNNSYQAHAALRQADVLENRAELSAFQAVIDILREELTRMVEAFTQVMEQIFQMINAKGDLLHNLSSRPAAI
ncbi:hypothetical protein CJF35_03870 [Pseudomonas lundensis]|uniref:type III secretion system translocon subunit SctE n=1 Tax=Pseudomonas lundensis TaxID=86185 RepID=UPI000BA26C1F|nr:type III secretion system translocon subunit SctE [Pseudomonas lundensis]OZY38368.1 hypothetical protein CJF35_03870 [Pseudomonas lundensis]